MSVSRSFCAWALFTPFGWFTWDGALQESPDSSLMRAAAVGLLELMRTGGLISMEWRFWDAWEDLLAMVREVKEWRFLVFFLVSECFGALLLWAAAEVHSPASTPAPGGLSHSISCFAAELNCKPRNWHKTVTQFSRIHWDFFSTSFYLKFSVTPLEFAFASLYIYFPCEMSFLSILAFH